LENHVAEEAPNHSPGITSSIAVDAVIAENGRAERQTPNEFLSPSTSAAV
jgi:hypothetical protein